MSGHKNTKEQTSEKRLVIRAQQGGRAIEIMVQGTDLDIDYLARMVMDAAEATRVPDQRDGKASLQWRD